MNLRRIFGWRGVGGSLLRIPCYLYVALLLYGWLGSERQIFVPPPASYRIEDGFFRIDVERGERIAAFYTNNPTARFTILYSHGNAEDIGHLRGHFEKLAESGFSVLGYDYRGYGRSDGGPTECNTYRDVRAAYHYLMRERGIASSNIILVGRSVGSGPTVELASKEPVGGLVVQSGFTSAFRVMTHVKIVPFDRFENIARIGRVRCPILFVHGTADEVIAPWHTDRLLAAAKAPTELFHVPGAGHNDVEEVAGAVYFTRLRQFAERYVSPDGVP